MQTETTNQHITQWKSSTVKLGFCHLEFLFLVKMQTIKPIKSSLEVALETPSFDRLIVVWLD